MNKKVIIILSLIILGTFSGCIPFIKMESGRVIGKNKSAVGIMGTSYQLSESETSPLIPYFEAQAKFGITEKFELSGGFNSIGFLILNTKYQLIGDQTSLFALSLGLGGSSLLFLPVREGRRSDIKRNLNLSVPLYTSIHFGEEIYFFFTPQLSRQIIFDDSGDNINFFGISSGLGVYVLSGEINLGAGYFVPVGDLHGRVTQIGVSYRYMF